MACACRAAQWRNFVQGLAQVHKLEASSSTSLLPLRLRPSLPHSASHRQRYPAGSLHARRFHVASSLQQDAVAVATPEREPVQEISNASSGEQDMASPKADEGEAGEPAEKPKKKRGRKPKVSNDDAAESSTSPKPKSKAKPKAKPKEKTVKAVKPDPEEFEAPEIQPEYVTATLPRMAKPHKPDLSDARAKDADDTDPFPRPKRPEWQIQKEALKQKFPEGWKPKKRLSPDALAGIRALNAQFPDVYTTSTLASRFEVPAEAIRRILKSKWQPSAEEDEDRQERWFRRGMSVWDKKAALGVKPPKKWRKEGIARDPSYHEWSKKVSNREKEWEEEETRKYRETLHDRPGKKDL